MHQDDDTCGYYWWEGAYVKYLQGLETKRVKELALAQARETGDQQQKQMLEMRQELCEVKQQIEELKQQMCQGKVFVLNNAVVAYICVGVVIGLVLGMLCK